MSRKGESKKVYAEVKNFGELLSEGCFRVPWYQRAYDWSHEEVELLLFDLQEALDKNRESYFLGTVMLMEDTSRSKLVFEINDGQQRIITVSLIFALLRLRFIDMPEMEEKLPDLYRLLFDMSQKEYEASSEEERLKKPLRVMPSEGSQVQYGQIVQGEVWEAGGKLTEAVKITKEFLRRMTEKEISEFYNFLINRVELVCVYFNKEVNPNSIFETLNARGKQLEELDKVRNYFYWQFTDASEKAREEKLHENLEKIRTTFPSKGASEYARCFLQCEFGWIRKRSFYVDLKKCLNEEKGVLKDSVFDLVGRMAKSQNMALYKFISSTTPMPDIVEKFNSQTRRRKYEYRSLNVFLNELRPYTVAWPLFYALLHRWWICTHKKDFSGAKKEAPEAWVGLNTLSSFVTRTSFIVSSFRPSDYEEHFASLANNIYKHNGKTDILIDELHDPNKEQVWNVRNDEWFRQQIEGMSLYNNAKAKKFLIGIEESYRRSPVVIKDIECTLEHILPESPNYWDSWKEFGADEAEYCLNKIGNLAILSQKEHRSDEKFNRSFTIKCKAYENSQIKSTSSIADYSNWDSESIKKRQKKLAAQALKAWPF